MEQPIASTSKLGNCATIKCEKKALYKCPACSFPSCSLKCSISHKLLLSCTGIAPPIWSKKVTASEWGWGTLMRDQSYISSIGRLTEQTGKNLVSAGLIPKGRSSNGETGVLDDRSEKEDKLIFMARSVGVLMVLLPKGMSRRSRNASRWDLKEQRMEWTTEVIFQPRSINSPSNPPIEPLILTLSGISSTQTLYQLLTLAMDNRDKKGKGKVSEEELEAIKTERDWLNSLLPTPPVTVSLDEGGDNDDLIITSTVPLSDSESPYLFLLAASSIPSFSIQSSEDNNEESSSSSILPPPPSTISTSTSKPSPKNYYQPSIFSTLSSTLIGITILEFPTFEFISREKFQLCLSLGKINILPKADTLPIISNYSNNWDRGGRGRDRGRGGGRGGNSSRGSGNGRNGSGRGGSSGNGRSNEGIEGERIQDNGWGKRNITEVEGVNIEKEEEKKREKFSTSNQVEFEIEMVLPGNGSNQDNTSNNDDSIELTL